MEQLNQLEKILEGCKEDAVKFFVKGNKAAGRRLRKSMQDLKVESQRIRIEIAQSNKK